MNSGTNSKSDRVQNASKLAFQMMRERYHDGIKKSGRLDYNGAAIITDTESEVKTGGDVKTDNDTTLLANTSPK